MSGFKDFIRKNLNPIVHEVLRENRVTEIFIKEVIKDAKSSYFENGRKLSKYRHLPMPKIYALCRRGILDRVTEPTITLSFTWGRTLQGYDFWDKIDDQIRLKADNLR